MDDTTICRICLNRVNGQYVSIDSVMIDKLQNLCPDMKTTLLGDYVMCPSCIGLLQKFEYLRNKYNKTKETCKVCGVNVVDQYNVTSSDTLQMCDDLGFSVPIDSKVCDECINTIYELNTLKVALNCTQFKSAIKDEVELGPVELFQFHSNLDELNACLEINTTITKIESNCEKNNYCNKNDELLHTPFEHQVLGSASIISFKDDREEQYDELQRKMEMPENFEDPNELKSLGSQESGSHIDEEFHSYGKCFFKPENKGADEDHHLVHIKPGEVSMFECHICEYKTKHKNSLKTHLLIHKNPENGRICEYKAKHKGNFKKHLLIHKKSEDIEMFECNICEHKTKRRSSLKKHLLIHKKPEDVKMFECHVCEYKSIQKSNLNTHLLIHKKPEDVEMFECHICEYKTKVKGSLKTHLLIHKKPEDVDMFECHICKYKAKHKCHLKRHLLLHKKPEDVKMFECHVCQYKTIEKGNLKRHLLLIHEKPENLEMFECHFCKYKVIPKRSLNHEDVFERHGCEYKTKRGSDPNKHLPIHNKPEDVEMIECHICKFKTKLKSNFKKYLPCPS